MGLNALRFNETSECSCSKLTISTNGAGHTDTSQGSVTTHFRYGGICDVHFILYQGHLVVH